MSKEKPVDRFVPVEEYNKLVNDFNQLAHGHNALVDDAQALANFLSSICAGLRSFATMRPPKESGLNTTAIQEHEIPILTEERGFVKDIHNEIATFLEKLREGQRPSVLFDEWIKQCQDIASQQGISKGGIVLQ